MRDENETAGKRLARRGKRADAFEYKRKLLTSSEVLLCIMRNIMLLLFGQHEICLHNLEVMQEEEQGVRFGEVKQDSTMQILIKSMVAYCKMRGDDTKGSIEALESMMQLCEIERYGAGNAMGLIELGDLKTRQYEDQQYAEDYEYAKEVS